MYRFIFKSVSQVTMAGQDYKSLEKKAARRKAVEWTLLSE